MTGRQAIVLFVLFGLVTLSGCGSDSSNSSLIVSSTPQNGATNFTFTQNAMQITVSKDLDPSSVNGATVRLRGRDNYTGRPIVASGAVDYISRTRMITFSPASGIMYNASYTLTLAGLKDASGNPQPDTTISFTTAKVMLTLSASVLGSTYVDGQPAGTYIRTLVDSQGNPSRKIHYNGPGPDGAWFSGDDKIDFFQDYTLDPANKGWRTVSHKSAGPDGVWFTADDPVGSYIVNTYNDGREITVTHNGAGVDGAWFTADDTVSGYQVTSYSADGTVSAWISYISPGPDGRWFTADDVYNGYDTYLYDANGNLTRQASSRDAGPDGIPFTADDPGQTETIIDSNGNPSSSWYSPGVTYSTMTYDANNRRTSSATYQDPGPDGIWFTPDDVIYSYRTLLYDADGNVTRWADTRPGSDGIPFTGDDFYSYVQYDTYDAAGHLVRSVSYNGPGPDGIWFNADDTLNSYTSYDLNGAGKPLRSIYHYAGPGPDGAWFTADDPVGGYQDYSYDPGGNPARAVYYSAGADGVMMTADDQLSHYEVTTHDASGRRLMRSTFIDSGPDGVWFTADDRLWSKEEYAYFP